MIRSEIRARIAATINDDQNIFVTADEANRSIDEAMEIIAEKTKCIRRTAFVSLREGANFYYIKSIADDMMYPYRIWNEQRNVRLTGSSFMELDGLSQTWLTTAGTPQLWFPVSWDFFGVYPHPATSGGVLRIDYVAWPAALMDDNDEPEMPESSIDSLIYFGAYEGQLKEWDIQAATAMYQVFMGRMNGLVDGMDRVQAREFMRSSGLELRSEINVRR